jgi:hypothetical protein
MPFSGIPSASQIRKRCSVALSTASPADPMPAALNSHDGTERKPTKRSRVNSFLRNAPTPPSLSASVTNEDTSQVPPSASSKRLSSSSSTLSFTSLKMLLLRHTRTKPDKRLNSGISGPVDLKNRQAHEMGEAPNLGKDEDTVVETWNLRYEELKPGTPPTPTRYGTPLSPPLQVTHLSERPSLDNGHGETSPMIGKESKTALLRTNSVRSFGSRTSSKIAPRPPAYFKKLGPGLRSRLMTRSSTSSALPLIAEREAEPRHEKKSMRSSFTKPARKSRSSLNLKVNIVDHARRGGPPPKRPARAKDDGFLGTRDSNVSLTNADPDSTGAIDPYGWEIIKPLPGRGRLTPDESVPNPRHSVSSGSVYSVLSAGEQLIQDMTLESERTEKHRRAAYLALDGDTYRRQKRTTSSISTVSSIKSDQDPTPPARLKRDSSSKSLPGAFVTRDKQTLLTVVEEESPAKVENALPTKQEKHPSKHKSQFVLFRGAEYKPWWEEQNIKDVDLCFEFEKNPFDDKFETRPGSQDDEDTKLLKSSESDESSRPSSTDDKGNSHDIVNRGRHRSRSRIPIYTGSRKPNIGSSESAMASSMTLPDIEKKRLIPEPLHLHSPRKRDSDTSSIDFWTDSDEKEMNTPATTVDIGDSYRGSKQSDSTEQTEDEIINSYLKDYGTSTAPELPKRSPKRLSLVAGDTEQPQVTAGTYGTKHGSGYYSSIDSGSGSDSGTGNGDGNRSENDQDGEMRQRQEDAERHMRVAEILGRLRGESTGLVGGKEVVA